MTKHVKVYLNHFGYGEQDFIPCEACGGKSVDIHHVNNRGNDMDVISNLMALCRKHHELAHSSKTYVSKEHFQYIHNCFMAGQRKNFLK